MDARFKKADKSDGKQVKPTDPPAVTLLKQCRAVLQTGPQPYALFEGIAEPAATPSSILDGLIYQPVCELHSRRKRFLELVVSRIEGMLQSATKQAELLAFKDKVTRPVPVTLRYHENDNCLTLNHNPVISSNMTGL